MKILFLFLLLMVLSCSIFEPDELRGQITWDDVLETSWGYTESLSTNESVYLSFHFHRDTLFLTQTYFNPNTRQVTLYNRKDYDSTFKFTVFVWDSVFIYPVVVGPQSYKTVVLPSGEINWIRYVRAPVFNKHYEIPPGPPPNDTNLVFTFQRKEYADATYHTPISSTSPLIDWFLWKIDRNGKLLMGQVDQNRQCWYWVFTKE
jgi:hypothetical protein